MQASVRFRPQLWRGVLCLLLALFFGALWIASKVVDPKVTMRCVRQGGHVGCEVLTESWPDASVVRLSERELRAGRLAAAPQEYDPSFRKVELRGPGPVRPLADFSQNVRMRALEDVNEFLEDPSAPASIASSIIVPNPSPAERWGLVVIQFCGLMTAILGFSSLFQTISIASSARELVVRRSRWPLSAELRRFELVGLADVVAVSRIPEHLAPIVANLPWRNVYRAAALAVKSRGGEEVLITDWSRRSVRLHERLAVSIRTWLPKSA